MGRPPGSAALVLVDATTPVAVEAASTPRWPLGSP
jgi:hypothetical protein